MANQARNSTHEENQPRRRKSVQCDLVLTPSKGNSQGRNENVGSIASISSWLDQRLRNPIPHAATAHPVRTDSRKREQLPDPLAMSRGAVLREAFATAAIDATYDFGPTRRSEGWSHAREQNSPEDHSKRMNVASSGRHHVAQVPYPNSRSSP
jgi:hypothetical protein